jgi:glyoxylase I family protein
LRILGAHHLAITTSRFELLRRFYVETLGLPVVGGFPEHDIVFVDAGNTRIELIGERPASEVGSVAASEASPGAELSTGPDLTIRAERRGWHHLAFELADVDAAFAELVERGVAVHSSPELFPPEAPTMRIAFLRDPDGNLLELIQPLQRHVQTPGPRGP